MIPENNFAQKPLGPPNKHGLASDGTGTFEIEKKNYEQL